MKRACVIGWPIEHSRSPLIHGYWLKRYGIDGSYTKVGVKPDDVGTFLNSLEVNGFTGCNVTVPHKEAAFALAKVRDPSALAVGAANTLWLERGVLNAANTDTYGYMTHLGLKAPHWRDRDAPVCILGAGHEQQGGGESLERATGFQPRRPGAQSSGADRNHHRHRAHLFLVPGFRGRPL